MSYLKPMRLLLKTGSFAFRDNLLTYADMGLFVDEKLYFAHCTASRQAHPASSANPTNSLTMPSYQFKATVIMHYSRATLYNRWLEKFRLPFRRATHLVHRHISSGTVSDTADALMSPCHSLAMVVSRGEMLSIFDKKL
jgi:hypothetical protein